MNNKQLIVMFILGWIMFGTLVYCSIRLNDDSYKIDSGFYYHKEGKEIIAYPDDKFEICKKCYYDMNVVDTSYMKKLGL